MSAEALKQKFSRNLRLIMAALDIGSRELAGRCGANILTVQAWRRGSSVPMATFFSALAKALELNPEDLFSEDEIALVVKVLERVEKTKVNKGGENETGI